MSLNALMSLSDEKLRQELRRRMWIGLGLLVMALAATYMGAHWVLENAQGPKAFTNLVFVLGLQAGFGLIVVFWMTRPMNERDRRKRLVLRQAIGAFPGND